MPENSLNSEVIEQITTALADGQKIQAIKIYREATGEGLREAKDFIDQLIPGLIEKDPERFASLKQAQWCGSAVLLLAIAGLSIVVMLT